MCGFAGILNNHFNVCHEQMDGIRKEVKFRGPDSSGILIWDEELRPAHNGNSAVFFNRLAVLDIDERSDQPFEDERYTLLFNGEIYNYQELKKKLETQGCVFRTRSDTEVLFYMLQKWETAALNMLNGMFSFCWIDRMKRKFLVARDRVGIKPLYYRQQGMCFIFSSELDSVLRLSSELPSIEPQAVDQFLWTQYIPTPLSIVQGVFKLPPGHFIEGSWEDLHEEQRLRPVSYWDAYEATSQMTGGANQGKLEDILADTLSRQLVADVPLGLFLSSGVDSSLLAAMVNKHFASSREFNFFTVAFSESTQSDESRSALDFIKGFNNPNLKSHTLTIDSKMIGNHLDDLYRYFDEPFGDQTALLNWVISIKAREMVTVALSGDGADELFWGYDRYDRWKNPSMELFSPFSLSDKPASLFSRLAGGGYWKAKYDLELEPDPVKRHFSLFLSPAIRPFMTKPPWELDLWCMEHISLVRDREDLTALMDIKSYLADAMLHKVDRASMAASLEVRVPYLDNAVVDFSLSMPLALKSNKQFLHKAILKDLLQQLAPHYPISRPKRGFNFPLDKWLRFDWKEKIRSMITRESLQTLGLEPGLYLPCLEKYYAGDKRYCIAIWYLFNLVLWHEKFRNIQTLPGE